MPNGSELTHRSVEDFKLRLDYDSALPISAHRTQLIEALTHHQVIIVCGATGSGKSTQLPKICLEAGRATRGAIGHTQPRRIAARALANRIAQELGTTVGAAVGYKVRFSDHTGRRTLVKLMTDGILLKELESDRSLRRYDTLIIDEAHERSLNIDLLLGVLKGLLPSRPELRLIVTSATINPTQFSAFFGQAPIIEVSGRNYPVEVRYRPLVVEHKDQEAIELSLPEGIVRAVQELDESSRNIRGDTLIFLPGEKEIREAAAALENAQLAKTQILPLFSRQSTREQDRVFAVHGERRVVLATNVAETSLTVPGIRFVVDSGLARISRYSARAKVQRLLIESISQASAEQRKGRCGREAEGICIRLYSEEDYSRRETFTVPEVLRTNLASIILRMAALGLGEPATFAFLDPPDTRLVNDGVRVLQELKAMDDERRITDLGRQIAAVPIDPRLGRMLLAAAKVNCLAEMLVIAAFLEVQDPRERPRETPTQAAQMHALFNDARSDFMSVLNLWRAFSEQSAAVSANQLRKWCRERFLSFLRLREWQDLHSQLADALSEMGLRPNQVAASYTELHQAIITGFLGSIGTLRDRREYAGPRGIRFRIAPGTHLASKRPRWVVAGSLVETARVYARMVAAVDPQWIEAAAAHLVKRVYTEPHWVKGRGYVAAFETVTLFGLPLASRRRVNYAKIAPLEAREIFVREALVVGVGEVSGDFIAANRTLIEQVKGLEARIRRRDVLVDESAMVSFYTSRIPQGISTVAAFESWRSKAERKAPRLLYMSASDVMERQAPEAASEYFPDLLEVGGNQLPLLYKFEPTHPDDGITLLIPAPLVELLDNERLAWLVPGMRGEKVSQILRGLPKLIRKHFVPVPDTVRALLAQVPQPPAALPPFFAWIAQALTVRSGQPIDVARLVAVPLEDYLRINVRVIDANGQVLAEGRELAGVHQALKGSRPQADNGCGSHAPMSHRSWDFGDLAVQRDIASGGLKFRVYPALEDSRDGAVLVDARTAFEADSISRRGLTRLALLSLAQQAKQITQQLANERQLVLLSSGLDLKSPVSQAITWRAARDCFFAEDVPLPRTREAFEATLLARRAAFAPAAEQLAAEITAILQTLRHVRLTLDTIRASAMRNAEFASAIATVEDQLGTLFPANFIEATPREWLDHYPRYLGALRRRLERLPGNVTHDAQLSAKVAPFVGELCKLLTDASTLQPRAEVERLRWLIEEFRVSLFAQEMRTAVRVSEKRLTEQLMAAQDTIGL